MGNKSPRFFAGTPAEARKWGIKDGYWESFGKPMVPESLYVQQLSDRLGAVAVKNLDR